eukprot:SAG22_NODE_8209_length_674_cov_1.866087_1_plen_119_part_10
MEAKGRKKQKFAEAVATTTPAFLGDPTLELRGPTRGCMDSASWGLATQRVNDEVARLRSELFGAAERRSPDPQQAAADFFVVSAAQAAGGEDAWDLIEPPSPDADEWIDVLGAQSSRPP